MYFLALATDYDGTLAHGGVVDVETLDALRRFKDTGRRLLLVTGRELPDLRSVFRDLDLFECVVAENGALLYDPSTEEERVLAEPPPPLFVERLVERRVEPLSVGRCIVATWEPEEKTVLEVIHDLGLELQIIFNKGAVMVLPAGVNKATGLAAALEELKLSRHNVVGVGDAENDHAFMRACGCAAAVANALPMVKGSADIVLQGERGAGVVELMELISSDDVALISLARHGVPLGVDDDGEEYVLEPKHGAILIAGSSGTGKSTLATALTERMAERDFEFCVFDPEGDYDELEHAVSIGDAANPPQIDEALQLIERTETNVVVNTQSFALAERPNFFAQLLPQLAALRAKTGRPHWLLIDEAHHLLPARRDDVALRLPEDGPSLILITVHPEAMSREVLRGVRTVVAFGDEPERVFSAVAEAAGTEAPRQVPRPGEDEVVVWSVGSGRPPWVVEAGKPRQAHKRHTRKYATGLLPEEASFYFRGPHGALNLRAQNLMIFLQIAAGIDDGTWEHHRRAGDYSRWFRDAIKDAELAEEVAAIEADPKLDAKRSREEIRKAVSRRYTAPATAIDS